MAIKKQCNKIGCANLIPRGQNPPYCNEHIQEVITRRTRQRAVKKDKFDKFYNSPQWINMRNYILSKNNYTCAKCEGEADTVHHIKHLREPGGWELRLNEKNLMPICKSCHNKEHREKGGY